MYTSKQPLKKYAFPTCRRVVGAIVEGRGVRVLLQALVSVLKLQPPFLAQRSHRFAEVTVGGRGIKIQAGGGVVSQHPGKDWILVQVIKCAPRQCVQLHQSNKCRNSCTRNDRAEAYTQSGG